MYKATPTKVKKALKSLSDEEIFVMYLKGIGIAAIDERIEDDFYVNYIDKNVIELQLPDVRIYFDSFEIE